MQELSLNILDVAQNSISAGASLVEIGTAYDQRPGEVWLTITIADNGCGMPPETVARVTDPFYTTRTTRRVGLGIPLFKMAAELTGGCLTVHSDVGVGTTVTAHLLASHIDAMPLGDMAATFVSLVQTNPQTDFVYTYQVCQQGVPDENRKFTSDTRQFKDVLEGVPLSSPPVLEFIRSYINENMAACGNPLQTR